MVVVVGGGGLHVAEGVVDGEADKFGVGCAGVDDCAAVLGLVADGGVVVFIP